MQTEGYSPHNLIEQTKLSGAGDSCKLHGQGKKIISSFTICLLVQSKQRVWHLLWKKGKRNEKEKYARWLREREVERRVYLFHLSDLLAEEVWNENGKGRGLSGGGQLCGICLSPHTHHFSPIGHLNQTRPKKEEKSIQVVEVQFCRSLLQQPEQDNHF